MGPPVVDDEFIVSLVSRGARELTRTPGYIYKKKKQLKRQPQEQENVHHMTTNRPDFLKLLLLPSQQMTQIDPKGGWILFSPNLFAEIDLVQDNYHIGLLMFFYFDLFHELVQLMPRFSNSTGRFELLVEIRSRFYCGCSCDKVRERPFPRHNQTKPFGGHDHYFFSSYCSCFASDQAKSHRAINRTGNLYRAVLLPIPSVQRKCTRTLMRISFERIRA